MPNRHQRRVSWSREPARASSPSPTVWFDPPEGNRTIFSDGAEMGSAAMSRDPASRGQEPRRDGPGFWPTPPCLTWALIEHVLPHMPPAPHPGMRGRRWAPRPRHARRWLHRILHDIEPRGEGIKRRDSPSSR